MSKMSLLLDLRAEPICVYCGSLIPSQLLHFIDGVAVCRLCADLAEEAPIASRLREVLAPWEHGDWCHAKGLKFWTPKSHPHITPHPGAIMSLHHDLKPQLGGYDAP